MQRGTPTRARARAHAHAHGLARTRFTRCYPERSERPLMGSMRHAWVACVISHEKGDPSPSTRLGMTRVFCL